MSTVAETIVAHLKASGVRRVYGLPGDSLNGFDVVTRRQELSVPPHVTFSEMKGVSLFAGRTILSGRGDELVELARGNVTSRLLR